jgi:hypothetical protein
MKKIFISLTLLPVLLLSSTNSFGMLRCIKHTVPRCAFIQQRFHTDVPRTSRPIHTHWEKRAWIEDNHEEWLLKNPEFRKKIENQQLTEIKELLKENNNFLHAIIKQNHLLWETCNQENISINPYGWSDKHSRTKLKKFYRLNNINLDVTGAYPEE